MNKINESIELTCLGAGTFPLDNLMKKDDDSNLRTIYQHIICIFAKTTKYT